MASADLQLAEDLNEVPVKKIKRFGKKWSLKLGPETFCQRELNTRTLVMYMLNCTSGRRTGSSPCARKRVRAALAMPHQCPAILA